MIRITAKQDGFRRCGVAHPKTATEHQDDVFTPDQLEQLQNEPMLVVTLVGYQAPDGGSGRPNVKAAIEALKAATSIEDFDKLLEGEDRDSVLKAAANLRKKLEP